MPKEESSGHEAGQQLLREELLKMRRRCCVGLCGGWRAVQDAIWEWRLWVDGRGRWFVRIRRSC